MPAFNRIFIAWLLTCLVVTPLVHADPTPTTRPTVLRDLRYGPAGTSNLLDLYLPERVSPNPVPLIVFIHGGAWVMGSKLLCPAVIAVHHGYAVASINYRLATLAPFPAQLFDCKGAVRWLRAHAADYGLDARRVAVFGESAGGHLAALVGTTGDDPALEGDVGGNLDQSSTVQAVIDWFGPTDLIALADVLRNSPDTPASLKREPTPLTRLLGGPIDQRHDVAQQANPIHYVDHATPPFVIMHGLADPLVPPEQSRLLADALHAAGVPSDLTLIPGAGQVGQAFAKPAIVKKLFAFLEKTVGHPDTPAAGAAGAHRARDAASTAPVAAPPP